jgi:hypothetical protein
MFVYFVKQYKQLIGSEVITAVDTDVAPCSLYGTQLLRNVGPCTDYTVGIIR